MQPSSTKLPQHLQEVFLYMAKPPRHDEQPRSEAAHEQLHTHYKAFGAHHGQPERSLSVPQTISVPVRAVAGVQPVIRALPELGVSSRVTVAFKQEADGAAAVVHTAKRYSDFGHESTGAAAMGSQLNDHTSSLSSKGLQERRFSVGSTELPEEQQPEGEVMHPADVEEAQGSPYIPFRSRPQSRTVSVIGAESLGLSGMEPRRSSVRMSLDSGERRDWSAPLSPSLRIPRTLRALPQPESVNESPNADLPPHCSRSAVSGMSCSISSRTYPLTTMGRRVSLQKPVFDPDEES